MLNLPRHCQKSVPKVKPLSGETHGVRLSLPHVSVGGRDEIQTQGIRISAWSITTHDQLGSSVLQLQLIFPILIRPLLSAVNCCVHLPQFRAPVLFFSMYLAAVVPQSLQVLCFGNSLTQGWPSLHPYEIALKAHIEDRLVPSTEVDTYNWGQGGDRVVQGPGGGQYYPRINEACRYFLLSRPSNLSSYASRGAATEDISWCLRRQSRQTVYPLLAFSYFRCHEISHHSAL